jgi:hypothetical protein
MKSVDFSVKAVYFIKLEAGIVNSLGNEKMEI